MPYACMLACMCARIFNAACFDWPRAMQEAPVLETLIDMFPNADPGDIQVLLESGLSPDAVALELQGKNWKFALKLIFILINSQSGKVRPLERCRVEEKGWDRAPKVSIFSDVGTKI